MDDKATVPPTPPRQDLTAWIASLTPTPERVPSDVAEQLSRLRHPTATFGGDVEGYLTWPYDIAGERVYLRYSRPWLKRWREAA